jgi:regulator of CtrA degradation
MRDQTAAERQEAPVSFAERVLGSETFMQLFREGMTLVEDTAAYLDGEGRTESRKLDRIAALTYASESMKLTTRLMQMTSWLLLQRAVREGELTQAEASEEHRKVKLRRDDILISADNQAMLPERLAELIIRADRLSSRILRLDTLSGDAPAPLPIGNGVADQLGALQAALGARFA